MRGLGPALDIATAHGAWWMSRPAVEMDCEALVSTARPTPPSPHLHSSAIIPAQIGPPHSVAIPRKHTSWRQSEVNVSFNVIMRRKSSKISIAVYIPGRGNESAARALNLNVPSFFPREIDLGRANNLHVIRLSEATICSSNFRPSASSVPASQLL
jgi:hypothetical protein